MIDFGILASEVFQTLRAFNYDVKLFDATGNEVLEPRDTRRFFSKAEDLAVVLLEDAENSTIKVIKSNSVSIGEIQGFTRTIKSLSDRYNVLFNIEGQDGAIKPRDFTRYNIGEDRKVDMDLTENMYGTSRSSYLKYPNARLIVKHSSKVDEAVNGARSRKIDRMYVENARGERLLLPTRHLSAGKAMAQHVSHGGELSDDNGQKICEMAKDYHNLGLAIRHVRKNETNLSEDAGNMKISASKQRAQIRNVFEKLHRNYENGIGVLAPALNETSSEDMEGAKSKVAAALTCEGCDLDEAIIETMARCSFNLEKEPLEEKAVDLVDVCGTNVDREVFLKFAQNHQLDFTKKISGFDFAAVKASDHDSLARAAAAICHSLSDDGMANLFSKIGEEILAGNASKLALQIAARAVKIAAESSEANELRNPVMREHFDWLESFSVENILLSEKKDSDCCDEEAELSREDVVLPKSSSADLKREVVKKAPKMKKDTSALLLDDEK